MNTFIHHPDGIIIINGVQIKLEDFLQYEPDYFLPAGMVGREFVEGARSVLFDGFSQFRDDAVEALLGFCGKSKTYSDSEAARKIIISAQAQRIYVVGYVRSGTNRGIQNVFSIFNHAPANPNNIGDYLRKYGKSHSGATGVLPDDNFIYAIRHPYDVAISMANFLPLSIEQAIDVIAGVREYFVFGAPVKDLVSHYNAWESDKRLIVRYEDYSSGQIAQIAAHFGTNCDADQIFEWNNFDRIKAEQNTEALPYGYANVGTSGRGAAVLTQAQKDRIVRHCNSIMEIFKYEP
jgi:hypothetical protein